MQAKNAVWSAKCEGNRLFTATVQGANGVRAQSCLCLRRKPQENGLDVVTDGIELALESVNPYVDALEPLVYQVNPCVCDLHTGVDLLNTSFQPGGGGSGAAVTVAASARFTPVSARDGLKVGRRQDMNTGGVLRSVHERSEIPQIAGEQVGCPASDRGLEDGPVLLRKARRKRVADGTFDEPDTLGQRIQAVKELRKLPGQIPPRLLQGMGAGVELPMSLLAEVPACRDR